MRVAIVDYGVGNLRSVQKVFERVGCQADIAGSADAVRKCDAIVLPGVGAFGDAMAKLEAAQLAGPIRNDVLERKKPILGICLGMQILAEESSERGRYAGLGIVRARVEPLETAAQKLRLPHIGWNSVTPRGESALFQGVPDQADFYFAHSYHVVLDDPALASATCEYGRPFHCAIEADNVFATQFHPEKSQKYGMAVIGNFLRRCGGGTA